MEWIKVSDRLPKTPGWYLVYAPNYFGGSSGGKQSCNGLMFSKFSTKGKWSIEVGYHERPGCVTHWAPLETPAN
jgi:hypothetical protein